MPVTVEPESDLLTILDTEGGWQAFCEKFPQAPHPLLPTIDEQDIRVSVANGKSDEWILDHYTRRENAIRMERADPLNHGYEPQMWKDADDMIEVGRELLVLGSNRSGKTEYAAKRIVQLLRDKPGAIVWCFSTNHMTSIRDQQRMVWKYLPVEWKAAKRSKTTNISYSQKGGFTEKAFVAPNGSECRFLNYQQDSEVIEGGQVDLWWADELIPADWVITLRSRTIDRKGKGIITQTPIKGYTPTVAEYLASHRVFDWVECDQLPGLTCWPKGPPGKVPYRIQPLRNDHKVIFFHAKNNPYIPYEELVNAWKDKGTINILCRLWGVTSGVSTCQFPRLGPHNIIPHEKVPKEGGTLIHLIDFAGSKPWFMLWAKIIQSGDRKFVYVYRDWPDMDSYGEWALRSEKPDGAEGPAQTPLGHGINDYKRLILSLENPPEALRVHDYEGPEKINARYGDPRSGRSTQLAEEGAGSIFVDLENETEEAPSMIVMPVVGTDGAWLINEGINRINTWLEYNEDKPIDSMNCPSLYFSDRCQNTIECMKIWTGRVKDGFSKDPVDLVRYLAITDPEEENYDYVPSQIRTY